MNLCHLMKGIALAWVFVVGMCFHVAGQEVGVWMRFEKAFTSSKDYTNAIYDARLSVKFTSPTGKVKTVSGFWDGGRSWKVRFMPDEKGSWQWVTECSDKSNTGLHGQTGSFVAVAHNNKHDIYKRGAITRTPGLYHLEYADGTPFFWVACTAWNGALKSTDEEWQYYLDNRVRNRYNVIQFVTTQWRGCDRNRLGQVAFEGSGRITINPDFFKHLDKKFDAVNDAGLVAAPVMLWALQSGAGRHLSPGYHLPDPEAILLAKYILARYGAHHVVWLLGGDGKYIDQYEYRWKNIGRGVFGGEHPGLVALHSQGKSWIGDAYKDEAWLDIIGYQTGHNSSPETVNWITRGPVASGWNIMPPKIFINMEPVYEEIHPNIDADDVRQASYWSVFSTPTAGITYGANGIWPWLRDGEEILNHGGKGEHSTRWREALQLPGSIQIGYLGTFMQTLEWWKLKPANELLVEQPGEKDAHAFVSVSRSDDRKTIVAYVPVAAPIALRNPNDEVYEAQWFDPVANRTSRATWTTQQGVMRISAAPAQHDHVLVLKKKR